MGMIMLLLAVPAGDLSLGPEATTRLAHLGVTYAALLTDDEGVSVIIDGSMFDPERSTPAALAAIGAGAAARTLRPVAQMSLSST